MTVERSRPAASLPEGLGAVPLPDGTWRFRVWAPLVQRLEVRVLDPRERLVPLTVLEGGLHEGVAGGLSAGARYVLRLDGGMERPDPASRLQPEGVHGPSALVDPAEHEWRDAGWRGHSLADLVIYELHVGTFTEAGTFDAIQPHLPRLRELGVTAIELMPVAAFPGRRNWGYDGVCPFAAHAGYGGPRGLRRLVDAAHRHGLAVILDVVHNHLGPEGNYLRDFGPYFTDRYRTPWGEAVNFDGPDSDGVRAFFIDSARHWIREQRIDGLRLDSVDDIYDRSARPFLAELTVAVHEEATRTGVRGHVIAESDQNDSRLLRPRSAGGHGMDAVWSDDFHHALHMALTGERQGYYADFGGLPELATAMREGWAYAGQYSGYRRRRHGSSPNALGLERFVTCAQNHDQVGNRMLGERLSVLVEPADLRLAAAVLLLSPTMPLLFMGEEHGETAPFLYFTDHSDAELARAVREGRRKEFAAFAWQGEPPDPQDERNLARSRIRHELRDEGWHAGLYALYRELLRLRRELPALRDRDRGSLDILADPSTGTLTMHRRAAGQELFAVFAFGGAPGRTVGLPDGSWRCLLDTTDRRWGGPSIEAPVSAQNELRLAARSALLYARQGG